MKLVKVQPHFGALRFFTIDGEQVAPTANDTFVEPFEVGVSVSEAIVPARNEHEKATQGTFVIVDIVTFPNGKVHCL